MFFSSLLWFLIYWLKQTMYMSAQSLQSCPILWDPMDYSPPKSSFHGILQARILEWVAMPSSRGFSQSRDQTCISCITGRFFTTEPSFSFNSIKIIKHLLVFSCFKIFAKSNIWVTSHSVSIYNYFFLVDYIGLIFLIFACLCFFFFFFFCALDIVSDTV